MSLIQLTVPAREADIGGGLTVHRLLPWRELRMVGPFIFLDHMGPARFGAGAGIDVKPHPHIGLATVTYLFEGSILHRDTLGSQQEIRPGDVNWMTAGRGIAHSERTGSDLRRHPHRVHGLQSWVALPKEHEENEPGFFHHAEASLPQVERPGVILRVVAGEAYGAAAPVKTFSPLFYVAAQLEAGARLELPDNHAERAAYVISGDVGVAGATLAPNTLPVFAPGKVIIEAQTPARLMLLGGAPLPEPRYIWWNFVSSSKDRLEQAKEDWRRGRFGKIPGDDAEFVPLPGTPTPGNIL